MKKKLIIFVITILVPSFILSQDLSRDEIIDRLQEISNITQTDSKLEALDFLLSELDLVQDEVNSDPNDFGNWMVQETTDRFTDQEIKAFYMYDTSYNGILIVKAIQGGSNDIGFAWVNEYTGTGDIYVKYRFDKNNSEDTYFSGSSDGETVIVNSTISNNFLITLKKSKILVIQATKSNGVVTDPLTFKLDGFRNIYTTYCRNF